MVRLNCLCFFLLFLIYSIRAIPINTLYDHFEGLSKLSAQDEVSSPEIKLNVPVVYYNKKYSSLYVNSNGIISFETEIPEFFNVEFPLDYAVIAPFYSNVDISGTGTISYYETNDPILLQRSTKIIQESYTDASNFRPKSLFIVSWDSVGYHSRGTDKLNTYQVVIASDGNQSYAEFIYPEGGIQWIQGMGQESGLPDARAQVGFVSAEKRYFLLPGSGTNHVKNLEKLTNTNTTGVWLFRIGVVGEDGNIVEPDVFKDRGEDKKTCEKGAIACHSFAKCEDYSDGFCCNCKSGYYGNGKYCIKNDAPLRVNGKASGNINGFQLEEIQLQAYIAMVDARSYTALSKISNEIGPGFQSLQPLGNIVGWLFGKPTKDSLNGFQLTGGVFNYTATITFPSHQNKKATIHSKFLGLDVFDHLHLETKIEGEIPQIPSDTKISMPPYEEMLTLTAPGVVQSTAERNIKYSTANNEEVMLSFQVDQNIVFSYCPYGPELPRATWRLKVSKNFISYESREQIIRFGLSSRVTSLGEADPCEEGRKICGPDSSCLVENDSFRCVCNPGFQHIYINNQAVCQDTDECQAGLHDCHINAECVNLKGSFTCRCVELYEGDGKFCEPTKSCNGISCPPNSECKENPYAYCECLQGFVRAADQSCVSEITQNCFFLNNCSPYGSCVPDLLSNNQYYCVCQEGYVGDGYYCRQENVTTEFEITTQGTIEPQCSSGSCKCPSGYKMLDNFSCVQETEITTIPTATEAETEVREESTQTATCTNSNDCHIHAQCVYVQSSKNFQCICNFGFEGDGYDCRQADLSCAEVDICDIHALCKYNDTLGKSICVCDVGYEGDGKSCSRTAICRSETDCALNEQCRYVYESQGYECACKEGYERDSQHVCNKLEGLCGAAVCAENAECLYDRDTQINYCQCKRDFIGDGLYECKTKPLGCDVTKDCAQNAVCHYEAEYGYYQCKCLDGFHGDGKQCFPERNCWIDPYMCDVTADCVLNSERKYVCQCKSGYSGDGQRCIETPTHEGNFLLVNQGVATLKIPFDASKKKPGKPVHIEIQIAVGLDIDCFNGRVYWSDINGKTISSSLYNGSSVERFITKDLHSPEGLSFDWVSRNLYWTDSTKDTVEVANLDNKLRKVLFNTSLVNPRGIAVHPQRGKIFWSDWDRDGPKIEWANADGTERQIFLQGDMVKLPNSLTIDFDSEQLCFADAGTKNIECVDIDSRIRHIMAVNCTYPFGIAITDKTVYWTDWISKKIERVDKFTLKRLPSLNVPLGGSGNNLYGLAAVPQRCPSLTNVCERFKNRCPDGHFCAPDGKGSRKCLCGKDINSTSIGLGCQNEI